METVKKTNSGRFDLSKVIPFLLNSGYIDR